MSDRSDHNGAGMKLANGSRVAVVGGGPAGSFFTIFALDLAERTGLELEVDILDPKDFHQAGPAHCNHCGGIVSESLVQILAAEGISIPTTTVHRGIDSYVLHTDAGSVRLETPLQEMRIAAMHRGAGPKGAAVPSGHLGFDGFLQGLAVGKGARLVCDAVAGVEFREGRPELIGRNERYGPYDLVVGAVGLNPHSLKVFENALGRYRRPTAAKAAICEFRLGADSVHRCLGNSMHTFLLNLPHLTCAAVIPKGDYATLVVLGSRVDKTLLQSLLRSPALKALLPDGFVAEEKPACQCLPQLNVQAATHPYADRFVMIGDCGVSKLYKNGIGAAYVTAKAAASTAVMHGIAATDFHRGYRPACRKMVHDNAVGRLIFAFTSLIQRSRTLQKAVLRMVHKEQGKPGARRLMSRVLWDAFTGSAPYRDIFVRTLHPVFGFNLLRETIAGILPFHSPLEDRQVPLRTRELGRRYADGEIIIREGDEEDCLYVIQSGEVEVSQTVEGREVPLARLGKDDFFGETALFTRCKRTATVKARGEVRALTVDRSTLMRTIQENPSLAFRLLERLSQRVQELDQKLAVLRHAG
ncbi:MAG: cyclic nucleotide-binding domain-containing protein [Verrucomicrobiales bacterium]|nr:cyclic nucleotide-binding domain-containing protein [Verrucomicrobiales bacterium]